VIRIVTYNVSGIVDRAAVVAVLRRLNPTIVCLLERPGRRRLRSLAKACDLEVAARAGRRGGGTAILVNDRVRVLATAKVPLLVPRDVPSREATQAIVGVDGIRISVTAVQFGLRPEVRQTNHEELLAYLGSIDLPKVIGADLNESVRSPVAAALAERFQDAFDATDARGSGATYPTTDLSTRQDFVFVDHRLRVVSCRVPTEPPVDIASHHRPVVAEIEAVLDGPAPGNEEDDRP
jgi:endonuclease/exonuclease/phosphatase family metal-dependent hydrolase